MSARRGARTRERQSGARWARINGGTIRVRAGTLGRRWGRLPPLESAAKIEEGDEGNPLGFLKGLYRSTTHP